MKIYKNEASVTLSLDEFLDLLEEDALDDILFLLEDLEATGSITGADEITYISFDSPEMMDDLLESLFGDIDGDVEFDVFDAELMDDFFGQIDDVMLCDGSTLMDNLLLSNEDLRVKKIVERFQRISKE